MLKVLIIIILAFTSCAEGHKQEDILNKEEMIILIKELPDPPQRGFRFMKRFYVADYCEKDWEKFFNVARYLQKQDYLKVSEVMDNIIIQSPNWEKDLLLYWQKVFILNRIIFNIPNRVKATQEINENLAFVGYIRSSEESNLANGYILRLWPIVWQKNQKYPILISHFFSYRGGMYKAGNEYKFLYKKYGYRNLE